MLTPIYGEVDEMRGCREQGVGDSTVTFKVTPNSYDEPLMVLPEGWDRMSEAALRDWSIGYAVSMGRLATPQPRSGQVALKGDYDLTPATPTVRDMSVCECCGSSYLLTMEDGLEDGVRQCGDCGWDSVDSIEYLSAGKTDTELIDRQPGDGWFLGSRPGGTAMYSTDEFAASRVTYHEGEPVMTEVPLIEWDAYPAGWDVPVESTGGNTPYDQPRRKEG